MDHISLYAEFLKKYSTITRPLSIVADASNGATGKILERLLPSLPLASFTILNGEADPDFKAHGPNPLLPGVLKELSATVVEKKADFGVAFDADGDRAFFTTEKGVILPSFIIAALLFKHSKPPFVADELVYQALHHMNIFKDTELFSSRVGVFYIKEKIREMKATVGAEFSGHFYFTDFFGADSGLFTLLSVASILSKGTLTLSEFCSSLPPHEVRNEDLKIEGKDWVKIQENIIATYGAQGATLSKREGITIESTPGWINVRPSNTEPILRLYAGAKTEGECLRLLAEVKSFV